MPKLLALVTSLASCSIQLSGPLQSFVSPRHSREAPITTWELRDILAWARQGVLEQKDLENLGTICAEVGTSAAARRGRFDEIAFAEIISVFF